MQKGEIEARILYLFFKYKFVGVVQVMTFKVRIVSHKILCVICLKSLVKIGSLKQLKTQYE